MEASVYEIENKVIVKSEVVVQRRKRKKTNYKKINNQTRQKLIEMVYLNDCPLKDAAKILGINYSTAKTILRIFRIEKRIQKKNADEERELKEIIFKFKKDQNDVPFNEKKVNQSEMRDNFNENLQANFNTCKNDIYLAGNLYNYINNNFIPSDNLNEEFKTHFQSRDILFQNPENQKFFLEKVTFLMKKVNDFQQELKGCFENIKLNQDLIHKILECLRSVENQNNPLIDFNSVYDLNTNFPSLSILNRDQMLSQNLNIITDDLYQKSEFSNRFNEKTSNINSKNSLRNINLQKYQTNFDEYARNFDNIHKQQLRKPHTRLQIFNVN